MKDNIEFGYCHCGCGEKTNIATRTVKKRGKIEVFKGEPRKFLPHHRNTWCSKHITGKVLIQDKEHPRTLKAKGACMISSSLLHIEAKLGYYLPIGVRLWHFDGDTSNLKSLIICQNFSYMSLLMQRKKAYETCGHANFRKCKRCKEYDDPKNMIPYGRGFAHRMSAGKCLRLL